MVMLVSEDVKTREVLEWEGVHLLHFAGSSCSQKVRIFLNLKEISWESHPVDIPARENIGEWFMGINPRGLVPVLVHDGRVIIESNDILEHLERAFPNPSLIPSRQQEVVHNLLRQEDDLHLALRAICMRYFFPGVKPRSPEWLATYAANGSGTVQGEPDPEREIQLAFHKAMADNDGISDVQINEAVDEYKEAFDSLESMLKRGEFLLGDSLSVLDIAWYIYVYRLKVSGYPFDELHPRVAHWFECLDARPEFNREIAEPPPLLELRSSMQKHQFEEKTDLRSVAAL
ncbi:MAG: glutathione S-transferase family protein [Pseudomonadota bacterium]